MTQPLAEPALAADRPMTVAIKRALLVYPPTGKLLREDRCQADVEKMNNGTLRTPIDLLYVAATMEAAGVEVVVRDYTATDAASWDAFGSDVASMKPDVVVISATTPTLEKDLRAAEVARRAHPPVLTIAKGAHFLADDGQCFKLSPDLDVVVRGEWEIILGDLARRGSLEGVKGITYRRNGEIHRNPDRPLETDLDRIPFPARHLIDNTVYRRPDTGKPQTTILASRGCPYQCIYCLAPLVSGEKVRFRSPGNVVDEMQQCVERYGIRDFFFLADTFTIKKSWTIDVCREILDRKLRVKWCTNSRADTIDEERVVWMKKAGCWLVSFGLESGSQELLDKMKKALTKDESRAAIAICHKHGIKTFAYFIFGLPWETKETAEETIAFAKEVNASFTEFYTAYPFPGTELHEIGMRDGLFRPEDLAGESYTGYERAVIKSHQLDTESLIHTARRAAREFYLRPSFVWRTLTGIRSVREVSNYMRYGWRAVRRIAS